MSDSETTPSESESASSDIGGDAAAEEARERFREALDRKRGAQAKRAAHQDAESKVHGAHGSAGGQRMFRRKSGG